MKTATRISTLAYRMAIAAASLLAVAGCRGEHSSDDDQHDHAGHVIPAHKPKTFPDAVRRLRELNDQLVRSGVPGEATAAPADKTLDIALDIANWLPEIAAESDMPEAPWDEVNARSEALVLDYRTILAGTAAGDRDKLVHNAAEAISGLETLLAATDPRWFTGPDKHAGTP
jgi:hypothetical protein